MDDGLALTPPMGWNSWNKFGSNITEQLVREIADAMVESGMKDAGYEYVVIDDFWMAPERDAEGNLQPNPKTFPSGIKALADYVHGKGLKLGIYSSNGLRTCGGLPASLGYEEQDARKFAEWGVDYLKYDFCYSEVATSEIDRITVNGVTYEAEGADIGGGATIERFVRASGGKYVGNIGGGVYSGRIEFTNVEVPADGEYQLTLFYVHRTAPGNPRAVFLQVNEDEPQRLRLINYSFKTDAINSLTVTVRLHAGMNRLALYNNLATREITIQNYSRMRDALLATGRPIVFSICEWGTHAPWEWGAEVGHLWRTTGDITDSWGSVMSILDRQVGLSRYAGPGHWNDPDMLEVGNGDMSDTEYRAHFSLWALLNAPLMAGNDLRNMTKATREILTNKEVIAVNQDPAGIQGDKIRDDGDQEVWAKPLATGDRAVVLLNRGESAAEMVVDAGELGLPDAEAYVVRDLWARQDSVTTGPIRAFVPRHGVAMFRVRPGTAGEAPPRVSVSLKAEESPYILSGESKHLSATLVNDGPLAIEEIQMELAVPVGWSAVPVGADTPAEPAGPVSLVMLPTLAAGQMLTVGWVVTGPADLPRGTVELPLSLTYRYGQRAEQTAQGAQAGERAAMQSVTVETQTALTVPPAPPDRTSYLSDLEWVQAVNGWGPVERDRSNGETAAHDGRTLTIRRQTFAKGLGVHAPSEIVYYLGGKAAKFMAVVGVDDEARPGSVVFQVWGDGRKLYDSGVLKGSSSPQPVEADVRGVAELRLVVTDGGDGVNYDHADWADAKVIVTDEGL